MRLTIFVPIALIATATICAAACGTDTSHKATSPTPPASATRSVSGTATGAAGATATETEPAAVVTPGAPRTATPQVTAPAPPPGTRLERAPIDLAEVIVRESSPPQYAVSIHSGLPDGCHVYDHTDLSRAGSNITIDVWNNVPSAAGIACTAIYGTHEQVVELGSDLTPGDTYQIVVNDRTLTVRGE